MLETAFKQAGVPVDRKIYKGLTREFFGMAGVVAEAKNAQTFAGEALLTEFKH